MGALVVYESMYGSTRDVARSVGDGLAEAMPVDVVEVGALAAQGTGLPDGVTLLVVGGPTHAFGMTRASTRADAATEAPGPLVSTGPGIREWLDTLDLPDGVAFATFDTKVGAPIPGSAARAAEKRLRHLGGRRVVPARSFTVQGKSGGLVEGQLDAARGWGRNLGTTFAPVR